MLLSSDSDGAVTLTAPPCPAPRVLAVICESPSSVIGPSLADADRAGGVVAQRRAEDAGAAGQRDGLVGAMSVRSLAPLPVVRRGVPIWPPVMVSRLVSTVTGPLPPAAK